MPAKWPPSLIVVSQWLVIYHITQGDQEIASAKSLLPFLFLLVFHRTRSAVSGEWMAGQLLLQMTRMAKPRGSWATVVLKDTSKGKRPGSGCWCSCKPIASAARPSRLVLVNYAVALKYALCVKKMNAVVLLSVLFLLRHGCGTNLITQAWVLFCCCC